MNDARSAHPFHMYEAIHQQPERIAHWLSSERPLAERAADAAAARKRLILAGIGSSYHVAQIGEQFLRYLSGGRAHALIEQSFELVHYPLEFTADDAVVVISHRGWKTYSVQALEAARASGALGIAITGRDPGERIKAADFVLTTCEQEASFAHTKSYTTALAAMAAFILRLAESKRLLAKGAARSALDSIPEQMRATLRCEAQTREIAREIARRERWIFVGAGPNWATAREGALKAKETCYMPAEGFETEQFLHGPLAEIDSGAALVALLAGGASDARNVSVLRTVGELGVLRVAIVAQGIAQVPAEHRLEVPATEEWLSPFLQVVPLQLLSYWVALERGTNPDTGREEQPAHARARQHYKL